MMRRKRSSPSIAADGQPARLELQTAASHDVLHPFHGHLTQITQQGADGGFGRYRLIIEPWLAFLGYNRDSYLFQDKSVIDIVDELLGDWRSGGHRRHAGAAVHGGVQDRIAVMKLEDRGVLHMIRTGRIKEALEFKGPKGTLALPSEWTSLPGGKENAHRLTGDKKPMDMAYFQTLFDQYLDEEKAKG